MATEPDGRLAENILHFARTLRAAGLPVGTRHVIDALVAVTTAGIERRQDLYWALRAVLVQRQSELRLFNQSFHLYFRNPRLLERMMAMLLPLVRRDPDGKAGEKAMRRLLEAMGQSQSAAIKDAEMEFDQRGSWSDREFLRHKDFEQMTLEEQQEAKRLLLAEIPLLYPRPTRRFRSDARGNRYDLRQTLRQMQRGNADLLPLAFRKPRTRTPDIVLICDISGSMSSYSRMFLHFAHALTRSARVVHSFVFGTRLSHISRRLRNGDADEALRLIADDVRDWDGGTRIADSLREFNRDWGRRVLARNAIVILQSDGLERDTGNDLEFQMRRLRRSCLRLIWMNPLLRYEQFEARAGGIRSMLPHVDSFVPAHNLASIGAILEALQKAEPPQSSAAVTRAVAH